MRPDVVPVFSLNASFLVHEHGAVCFPQRCMGRPLADDIVEKILSFYLHGQHSRESPRANDVV